MILPSTYEISGELSVPLTHPVAFGGFCDIYHGSLGPNKVCVKRLRITATGDQALVKQVFRSQNLRLYYRPDRSWSHSARKL